MKFRPGQLVILLRAKHSEAKEFVGEIHTISEMAFDLGYWNFSPPLIARSFRKVIWHESDMRPIDGGESHAESTEAMRLLTQVEEKV